LSASGTVGGTTTGLSFSHNRSGWTIGAGIESKFDPFGWFRRNWTTRVEWLYVDLGNSADFIANCGGAQVFSTDSHINVWRSALYNFAS